MIAEPREQALQSRRGNGSDAANDVVRHQHGDVAEADDGCRLQTALPKVIVHRLHEFIEALDRMPKLGADAASQRV